MTQTLYTERLTLRPVGPDDLDDLYAHWTDPQVRRFLFDGVILPLAEVAAVVEACVAGFAASGQALWLITRGDGPLGVAGLRPLEDLGSELYYSLAPGAWGQGYAVEAARAVAGQAFAALGLRELLGEVDVGNAASVALLDKLGMVAFDTVPGELGPLRRYVLRP